MIKRRKAMVRKDGKAKCKYGKFVLRDFSEEGADLWEVRDADEGLDSLANDDISVGESAGDVVADELGSVDAPRNVLHNEDSVTKRDFSLSCMQRILVFVNSEGFNAANVFVLQARLELLEKHWNCYEAESCSLIEQDDCFLAVEEGFLEAKVALCQKITERKAEPIKKSGLSENSVVQQLGDLLSHVKMLIFNGDFTQWAAFRDLFRVEVH